MTECTCVKMVRGYSEMLSLLNDAMKDVDGVFHFAAMWLLHCRDFPRTALHVNIEGTFNVLESCVKNNVERLVSFFVCLCLWGTRVEVPMTEDHPFNNRNSF